MKAKVLSLIGDVAEGRDGPSVHVHVVLGLSDGTTRSSISTGPSRELRHKGKRKRRA